MRRPASDAPTTVTDPSVASGPAAEPAVEGAEPAVEGAEPVAEGTEPVAEGAEPVAREVTVIDRTPPATPAADRGRKTKLSRRVSPIDADGSAE